MPRILLKTEETVLEVEVRDESMVGNVEFHKLDIDIDFVEDVKGNKPLADQ